MSGLIEKIRNNLGITIDIVIAVIALLVILYVVFFTVPAVQESMSEANSDIRSLERFTRSSVTVPSTNPNEPDRVIEPITINRQVNATLQQLADSIDQELVQIKEQAIQRNRQGHDWLVNQLFPKPASPDLPHNAREKYLRTLTQLFGPPTDGQPGLDAGMPPSQTSIDEALQRVGQDELAKVLGPTATSQDYSALNNRERQRIVEAVRKEFLGLLQDRARQIHIYAQSDRTATNFPFSIVSIDSRPTMAQLWEAQMQLWIIMDVVRAIGIANQTADSQINVMDAPVKRLLELTVLPGHVGLHVAGGVRMGGENDRTSSSRRNDSTGSQIFSRPVGYTEDEQTEATDDIRPSDNFYITPSGRVSSLLYDVRHARLRAVVDFQQLPVLMDAINQVNFMTVLSVEMSDINEFAAIEEGYMYGVGDMVEVEMVIETLWLRFWTQEHMPDSVKLALGLIRREGEQTNEEDYEMWGPNAPSRGPAMRSPGGP